MFLFTWGRYFCFPLIHSLSSHYYSESLGGATHTCASKSIEILQGGELDEGADVVREPGGGRQLGKRCVVASRSGGWKAHTTFNTTGSTNDCKKHRHRKLIPKHYKPFERRRWRLLLLLLLFVCILTYGEVAVYSWVHVLLGEVGGGVVMVFCRGNTGNENSQ